MDINDHLWLQQELKSQVEETLSLNFNNLFRHLLTTTQQTRTQDNPHEIDFHVLSRLIFCDFESDRSKGTLESNKLYRQGERYKRMVLNVESSLDELNDFSKKPVDLVIFRLLAPLLHCITFQLIFNYLYFLFVYINMNFNFI